MVTPDLHQSASGRDMVDSTPFSGQLTGDFLLKAVCNLNSRIAASRLWTDMDLQNQLMGAVNRRLDASG